MFVLRERGRPRLHITGWGGVCAEMADQANLRPEKSVAVGTGDVRG